MELAEKPILLAELKEVFEGIPLVYFTNDRIPAELFHGNIALDVLPLLYNHLKELPVDGRNKRKKKFSRICLFLSSNGGNLNAPWPIVSLIREYCEQLYVIVPYKALSAATLISLGADKIFMSPLSQLSPVDPQGNFPSKKQDKSVPIEVEDVLGFIDFAKDKVGLAEQLPLTEALKIMVGEVDPTILGSINRTHALIRRLSKNLLKTHLRKISDDKNIEQIVDNLTQKLFSHQHFINRVEAKDDVGFGDMIASASPTQEKLMNKVLQTYNEDLFEANKPFDPRSILGESATQKYLGYRAIIESEAHSDRFVSELMIQRIGSEPQLQVNVSRIFDGWRKYDFK